MPGVEYMNYYYGLFILCICFALSFTAMVITKYKKHELVLLWAMSTSVFMASIIVFNVAMPLEDYTSFVRIAYVLGGSIFSLVCLLISNNTIPEKLFLTITNLTTFIIINYVSFVLAYNIFPLFDSTIVYWFAVLFRTILYIVYIAVYVFVIKKKLPKIEYKHSGRWWPYVAVSSAFLVLFAYIAFINDTGFDFGNVDNIVTFGLAIGLFTVIYIAVLSSISNMNKLERMSLVEQNGKYMKQQIDYLNATNEEMKKIRHDIRHHNLIIYNLAKNRENEKIVEYIDNYSDKLDSATYVKYCQNDVLNAILSSYRTLFENEKIKFECTADVENDTKIEDVDYVIIFANMLENALHGLQKLKYENKFCNISIKTKNDKLVILCKNTCSKKVKVINGRLEDEGVGISSIRSAINKYEGNIEYSKENDVLSIKAILNIK